ncbi:MAG: hypothetical protein GQ557_01525 [Mycoplasmataceae bacterium]|nr:hypothetical protein [Mycoplasmataceae bacterium]
MSNQIESVNPEGIQNDVKIPLSLSQLTNITSGCNDIISKSKHRILQPVAGNSITYNSTTAISFKIPSSEKSFKTDSLCVHGTANFHVTSSEPGTGKCSYYLPQPRSSSGSYFQTIELKASNLNESIDRIQNSDYVQELLDNFITKSQKITMGTIFGYYPDILSTTVADHLVSETATFVLENDWPARSFIGLYMAPISFEETGVAVARAISSCTINDFSYVGVIGDTASTIIKIKFSYRLDALGLCNQSYLLPPYLFGASNSLELILTPNTFLRAGYCDLGTLITDVANPIISNTSFTISDLYLNYSYVDLTAEIIDELDKALKQSNGLLVFESYYCSTRNVASSGGSPINIAHDFNFKASSINSITFRHLQSQSELEKNIYPRDEIKNVQIELNSENLFNTPIDKGQIMYNLALDSFNAANQFVAGVDLNYGDYNGDFSETSALAKKFMFSVNLEKYITDDGQFKNLNGESTDQNGVIQIRYSYSNSAARTLLFFVNYDRIISIAPSGNVNVLYHNLGTELQKIL